ncbi:KpsF/GutQ family sugar-phosphate isomerase [bacterium]|nr:KpsF/GutQ family sugar-phosphate isomerase [bacterium]
MNHEDNSITRENILNRAKEIFNLEIQAAQAVADRLGDGFVATVKAFHENQGKVIFVGAGKSGIVGSKVAATLRSIGIVSLFLHPADAMHGDLGMVSPGDIVVLISKSGETDEVLDLIPMLKARKAKLIAMAGAEDSRLSRLADIWLDVSVEREACPIGLAPTSSTTVTMLMGDALAAVLMQIRGVTPDDFAKNHPGGMLGKRLTLAVSDLMYKGADNPTVLPDELMSDVLDKLTHTALGGVSVVDEKQSLLGIVTDGDVRRGIQNRASDFLETAVSDVMTKDPVHVHQDSKAIDALLIMENRPSQIMVLPVVNERQQCVGLLRLHDLIQAGLRRQ